MTGDLRSAAILAVRTIDADAQGLPGGHSQAMLEARAVLVEALGADPATDESELPLPVAFVYRSKTGGDAQPHVVTVTAASPPFLTCTCRAFISVLATVRHEGSQPHPGCWAMKAVRRTLGLPEP